MKASGKAKLVDASVTVEKILKEVFQLLSSVVLLVELWILVALMVSVVEIHVVLVLWVGKSPNSEPQMTENSEGLWESATIYHYKYVILDNLS